MKQDIIESLCRLGFTNYEARAYLALLRAGTGTGYSIAKKSGIPSSKIYQVLLALAGKGAIIGDGAENNNYSAVAPDAVLGGIKSSIAGEIDALEPALELLRSEPAEVNARVINNYEEAVALIKMIIASTEKKLLLTAWSDDLEKLRPALETAAAGTRGGVFVLCCGEFEFSAGTVFQHRRPDLVRKEIPGRLLLAVADNREAVICFFHENGQTECISTSSRGITRIIADHIIHDISINKLMATLPEQVRDAAEADLAGLRSMLN
jgi:sugar-specific transcriptional regulator TrmB